MMDPHLCTLPILMAITAMRYDMIFNVKWRKINSQ